MGRSSSGACQSHKRNRVKITKYHGRGSIGASLRGMGRGSAGSRLWGMGRGSAGVWLRGIGRGNDAKIALRVIKETL